MKTLEFGGPSCAARLFQIERRAEADFRMASRTTVGRILPINEKAPSSDDASSRRPP